jgi:hypothetical protein
MALPFEITEAMIQCFGKCFYYKDRMEAFLRAAGVSPSLIQKHRAEMKYVWARNTLADLSQSESGHEVQRRILTELCKLRNVPDDKVPDRNAAIDALRHLKDLAIQNDLFVEEKKAAANQRQALVKEREKVVAERAEKLGALHKQFSSAVVDANRQSAGYSLERLLKELFSLFEIEYRPPYKTVTEQFDGHIWFEGFDYLVEARWRKDQPVVQEIGGFKTKVDNKLESTRGIFIAVQGIRPEVVSQFEGRGCNIIFWDGMDLIEVLEGRVDLRDAMKFKIEKAAQEGKASVSLREFTR